MQPVKRVLFLLMLANSINSLEAQKLPVTFKQSHQRIDVSIGDKPFTSFFYPDTLEKPVLYPVHAANGTVVTRSFPLDQRKGDPTDHPHHIGIWFNYENVNGLDFWNNSYAIPAEKKSHYGWIKTDKILSTKEGKKGELSYHARWTNQQNETQLEETTTFIFSGDDHVRIIDRVTTLTAAREVLLKDVKDGLLGFRMAHELQIPTMKDKEFKDDKGIITTIKATDDKIANGNYLTSEGRMGDSAWSTRARWCKAFAKMGNDSVSVSIIDHPSNTNYPNYWHARGYGLFAANPLGSSVFSNGTHVTNLHLHKGASVVFRYRVVVQNGKQTLSVKEMDQLADDFAKQK